MRMRSLLIRMVTVLAYLTTCLQVQAGDTRFYVYNAANGLADNRIFLLLLKLY